MTLTNYGSTNTLSTSVPRSEELLKTVLNVTWIPKYVRYSTHGVRIWTFYFELSDVRNQLSVFSFFDKIYSNNIILKVILIAPLANVLKCWAASFSTHKPCLQSRLNFQFDKKRINESSQ